MLVVICGFEPFWPMPEGSAHCAPWKSNKGLSKLKPLFDMKAHRWPRNGHTCPVFLCLEGGEISPPCSGEMRELIVRFCGPVWRADYSGQEGLYLKLIIKLTGGWG